MIEKYFVKQALKKIDLERFFEKHFARAGFNSLSIIKTPISTRLVIAVAKPGIAIGYSGKTIKSIGKLMEEKFGIKNSHIEVKAVEDANYNVKYIVQNIVHDLEKGINWKRVAYRAVKNLSDLPIMGFELIFKGKMMSKGGRKQKYRFVSGYLKAVGDQTKLVKFAMGTANTRSGTIGIRLKLVPPNVVFPDKVGKIEISSAIEKINKKEAQKSLEELQTTEKKEEATEKETTKKEKPKKEKTEDKKVDSKKVESKKENVKVEKKDEKPKAETKKDVGIKKTSKKKTETKVKVKKAVKEPKVKLEKKTVETK